MDDRSQSEETPHSEEERPDIKTRWKKGQSGNPKGRLAGSGNTVTWLARMLLERPVRSSDSGERITRLAEYMGDFVRRADAGDVKCRMWLVKAVERGDRRKEVAQRNAKKAKSEELRKFEEETAKEISTPMPPLAPEVQDDYVAAASPTAPAAAKASADKPQRPSTSQASSQRDAARAFADASTNGPHGPAGRSRADASTFQRNPLNGRLVTPEGREMSWEEEERLLYSSWPHISPHLKTAPPAGPPAGDSAGPESPAPESQGVDYKGEFDAEDFLQGTPPGAGSNTVH
jgi:hypothetical protein